MTGLRNDQLVRNFVSSEYFLGRRAVTEAIIFFVFSGFTLFFYIFRSFLIILGHFCVFLIRQEKLLVFLLITIIRVYC